MYDVHVHVQYTWNEEVSLRRLIFSSSKKQNILACISLRAKGSQSQSDTRPHQKKTNKILNGYTLICKCVTDRKDATVVSPKRGRDRNDVPMRRRDSRTSSDRDQRIKGAKGQKVWKKGHRGRWKGIKGNLLDVKNVGCTNCTEWSSADLDGDQGAGEILGVERNLFPGGEDTRGSVAHGLFQPGFGVFFILWELVDRGLV